MRSKRRAYAGRSRRSRSTRRTPGDGVFGAAATGASFAVQVSRTGPYDSVLAAQTITLQTNDDKVYPRGARRVRIVFSNIKVGEGLGVVFLANGFFKAPGFVASRSVWPAR